jgi:hypothetical protein
MLGAFAIATTVAGAFGVGCSSSSDNNPGTPSNDASSNADGTSPGDDGSTIQDSGPTCAVDASLTAFAASDAAGSECAQCFNTMCQSAINTCAHDCTCIDVFTCIGEAGTLDTSSIVGLGLQCAGNLATLANDPGISALSDCVRGPCSAVCGPLLPMDAGGDGSSATTSDGGDAGTADATPDGG